MLTCGVLRDAVVKLISSAAIYLPEDVKEALRDAFNREENPLARSFLASMLENVRVAEEEGRPLCQDTGVVAFYVRAGDRFPLLGSLPSVLREATVEATELTPLRPNAVDVISGRNSGDNTGEFIPWIDWEIVPNWDGAEITVMLKGGGSEGPSLARTIPPELGVKGALKIAVDSLFEAGAKPCPPVILGVGLGPTGDIAMRLAKRALLRRVGERHPRAEVAELEEKLLRAVNALGWGPHGVGGKATALDARIEVAHRHPAALAVGVAVNCWASRLSKMIAYRDNVEYVTHRFLNSRV